MRCSSFRPLLDDFVDGSLTPIVHARVLAHVDTCAECRGLLEELRVVDALLLTPRQVDPAVNFTFSTMAEVRSLPSPHMRRTPALRVIVAYLAFAWLAIGAWFVFGGSSPRATFEFFTASFGRLMEGFGRLAGATSHLFGHATPDVGVAAGIILAVDVLVAAALVAAWMTFRPRAFARAAARAREGTP